MGFILEPSPISWTDSKEPGCVPNWSKEGFLLFISAWGTLCNAYLVPALEVLSARSHGAEAPELGDQKHQLLSIDKQAVHFKLS